MASQPSYRPLQASSHFADGRASRPEMLGTVSQGPLAEDDLLLFTGKDDSRGTFIRGASLIGMTNPLLAAADLATTSALSSVLDYAQVFPFPVTTHVLERGRERFTIYCAVCHDPSGNGNGKIVQRGSTRPPPYISEKCPGLDRRGIKMLLRDAPVGYFFEVITNGYGAMPDYSAQVPPADRWAIIDYIRAL